MLLKKRLTRYGKQIIAEVFYEKAWNKTIWPEGYTTEVLVDSKTFNNTIFHKEPTEKHYEAAIKWADRVITLHFKYENL